MIQETFFNINHIFVIGGCALVVFLITSFIHHRVGEITGWWNPKWASFLFSVIIGGIIQFQFVQVLEPFHVIVMVGNIFLIFLSAVGLNAAVGKPIVVLTDFEPEDIKGKKEKASLPAYRETWRTRWFE
jgi:hypothetical protein